MGVVFFNNDAVLKWRNYPGEFEVIEPIGVTWTDWGGIILVAFTVLPGFRTDLATIPRVATSIIPKIAHHLRPSIIHDWLYEHDEGLTRLQADDLFLDAMRGEGVPWARRNIMHRAVRAFGGGLWGPPGQKKDTDDEEVFADN